MRNWLQGNKPKKGDLRGLPADVWYFNRLLSIMKISDDGLIRIQKVSGHEAKEEIERIVIPVNLKLRNELFSWSHLHIDLVLPTHGYRFTNDN